MAKKRPREPEVNYSILIHNPQYALTPSHCIACQREEAAENNEGIRRYLFLIHPNAKSRVRKLSLQLVLGLSIQPLLFPLTLFNTKFEPYTVRFRLFHSNPHNNLSSWYSYNYNLNIFRQPIPLDTRCIFIVLLFFVKKNTIFWGCVRWGNHFS